MYVCIRLFRCEPDAQASSIALACRDRSQASPHGTPCPSRMICSDSSSRCVWRGGAGAPGWPKPHMRGWKAAAWPCRATRGQCLRIHRGQCLCAAQDACPSVKTSKHIEPHALHKMLARSTRALSSRLECTGRAWSSCAAACPGYGMASRLCCALAPW